MARDGSGNYNLPAGQPVSTGTVIDSTVFNTLTADLKATLTASIAKDGQTTPTANLPMGGFKHTGVADATVRTQYGSAGQEQDSTLVTLGSVSGVDTITAALNPAITAYVPGQRFQFLPSGSNTGAVTINVNGVGAKAVVKGSAGAALIAGDLVTSIPAVLIYNGTSFYLQNPTSPVLVLSASYSWTGLHTFGNVLTRFTAAAPTLRLKDTGGAANAKVWDEIASSGSFFLQMVDDAETVGKNVLKFDRTGQLITAMAFGNATDNPTYAFLGTGVTTFTGALVGTSGSWSGVHTLAGSGNRLTLNATAGNDVATLQNAGASKAFLSTDGSGGGIFSGASETGQGFYVSGTIALVQVGSAIAATFAADSGLFMAGATGGSQGAGTINATKLFSNGVQAGFLSIPRSTTATTLALADVGKCVAITAAINIPASVFAAGDGISIYNDSAGALNITISAGTLRLAGTATTGTRSIAARGIATLWFNAGGATPEVIATGNVT